MAGASHASASRGRSPSDAIAGSTTSASSRAGSAAKSAGAGAAARPAARAMPRATSPARPAAAWTRSSPAAGNGASTPPSATQTPVTGERPCAPRAAFAGCSCSSICISDSQRRHGRACSPCGRCGWIAPRTSASGVVRGRAGPATVTNHASARGAWNTRPSSAKWRFSVAIIAAASPSARSSTRPSSSTSSRPATIATGSARSTYAASGSNPAPSAANGAAGVSCVPPAAASNAASSPPGIAAGAGA